VIFFDEWKSLSATGKKEIGIVKDRYESIWKEVILRLQEEARVNADLDVFRLFLLGGLKATVYWYHHDGGLSVSEIAKMFA
jgi:hypothetical protein